MKIFDLEDSALLSQLNACRKKAREDASKWRVEAEEDFNFAAGHQWDQKDITKLNTETRPIITFNRCNVILSAVLGMEANQRQEVKYNARKTDNLPLPEACDEVAKWMREYAGIPAEEAQAYESMLICGMGWSETRMDYETDLDGQARQDWLNPLDMWWDGTSRKRNLSDAKFKGMDARMTRDEIEAKFGTDDGDWSSLEGSQENDDTLTLLDNPPPETYKQEGTQGDVDEKQIAVSQMQWYELQPVWRVMHPQTREIRELNPDEYKQWKDVLAQNNIPVSPRQQKRIFYRAFFTKNRLLSKEQLPFQADMSLQCVTGKRDHINKQWFGLMRLAKDPQRWANKFLSTFIDILDSNAKGGIMLETGAVDDVRTFEESWAKTDSIAWMRPNSMAAGKVMPKPVAPYPQNVDRLLTYAIQAIHDVTGINLELLGAVDRAEIGVVVDSRKKSAYTILAPFFDSLKDFRMKNGLLLLECAVRFVPVERMAEVLPQKVQPIISEIKKVDLRRTTVIISESPQSDNNRYSAWMFMQQLLPQLVQLGVPIPPSVVEYSPLPAAIIEEWKGMLEGSGPEKEKMKQIQEMMSQLDMKYKQATTLLKQAQAHKAEADARKTEMESTGAGAQMETQKAAMELNMKQQEHEMDMVHKEQQHQQRIKQGQENQMMAMLMNRGMGMTQGKEQNA